MRKVACFDVNELVNALGIPFILHVFCSLKSAVCKMGEGGDERLYHELSILSLTLPYSMQKRYNCGACLDDIRTGRRCAIYKETAISNHLPPVAHC